MYTFKLRRATRKEWEVHNPVLADGEPGFEKDSGKLKIGNGYNSWNDLAYFSSSSKSTSETLLPEHIISDIPHPVYDNGASFTLLYENAKA